MKPLRCRSSLLMALALVACSGCGSTAPKPTLPAPEFEPPEVLPWDAGSQPDVGADAAVPTVDEQSPLAEPHPSQAELAPPEPAPAEPGTASTQPAPSSAPLAEPPTSVKIAPTP